MVPPSRFVITGAALVALTLIGLVDALGRDLIAFIACGLALAVTSVGGYLWGLELWSHRDSPESSLGSDYVRLGDAGMLAVVMAWAASARTYRGAAARPPFAVILFMGGLSGVVFGLPMIARSVERWLGVGVRAVYEYENVLVGLSVERSDLVALVIAAAVGLLALVAVRGESATWRRLATGSLVSLVMLDGLSWLVYGAQVAFLLAVFSAVWLVWALRRARTTQAARRGAVQTPLPSALPGTS